MKYNFTKPYFTDIQTPTEDSAQLTALSPAKQMLCYVVYGDDMMYYQGVKVSVLSFLSQIPRASRPRIVILSQKPDYFSTWAASESLDVVSLTLSESMRQRWCDDGYHYRIKTLGLAYIISRFEEHHLITADSKFLFFDSDTYFKHNPLTLYEQITPTQVVMYKQEPKISAHKKYRNYVNGLHNQTLTYDSEDGEKTYQLHPDAYMYSSLIMGVMPHMLPKLLEIASLMYPMRTLTNARTVEQFAFVEIMKQYYTIHQGKDYVWHYSRRRQKAYVQQQLMHFWATYPDTDIEAQISAISQIRFVRPWYLTLAQALKRIIKPEHIR